MPAIEFKQKPIGETTCADCGWDHATVRPNKRGMLWSYCDSCGSQNQTRTKKGSDGLRAKMRPLSADSSPPPDPEEFVPAKKAKPKPKAKPDDQTPPRRTGKGAAQAPEQKTKAKTGNLWDTDFLGIGPGANGVGSGDE